MLIDLPQVVDLTHNPQADDYLRRDCRNLTTWFRRHGVDADADELGATIRAAAGHDSV